MSTQLAHVYNVNRYASRPFNVICTPLNGKLLERMESAGGASHKRWKGIRMSAKRLDELWDSSLEEGASCPMSQKGKSPLENEAATAAIEFPNIEILKANVVYLTADSPHNLTKLEEGKTYIIGGIVDHNRYKVLRLLLSLQR